MAQEKKPCKIFVCADGKKCKKRGSKKIVARMRDAVAAHADTLSLKETGCLKLCKTGPSVMVMPDKVCYGGVTPKDCDEIVSAHASASAPVSRLEVTRKKKHK